ncbi:phage tail tape measure protein [Streptomyces sp. NPDC014776]|uniref:phage tail tape measure protein n=1 Tax=unclassified Streptomyces TaxID=2593676 RepID=UPI0036FC7666
MSSTTTRVVYDLVARDHASRTFFRIGEAATGLEKKSAGVGAAISRGLKIGGVALAALGAASAKAAADFEGEMTRISTQAGGTAKDVKFLSDQVLKLGGKVQQGPKELADSLYHLKSVGMENAEAMTALKEASDLAAVGHANLEQTTNALAGAWRTGIKGATSFHEAVATVNAIIGAGNMSMEQFNAAIGTGILPSAKTFGLSMQQVGAALALMTDEGIDSASAATRLRMSFSLLGAPSGAAEKQLKKIHLTGLQLAQAMRGKDGLIGALTLLKDHLDKSGMSAAQQSQLLSRAFGGGRSSSGILLMLNNLDVLIKKQEQINGSIGKFDEAVRQQRATAQAQWKRLTAGLESMSVRLGLVILPPITNFVGYINDKAIPAAARLGRTLGGMVPVGQIKSAIGEAQSAVSGFLTGLTGGKGIGGFFKAAPAPKSPIDKFPTTVLPGPLGGAPHLGSGQTGAKGGGPLQQKPHYGVGQVAPTTVVQGPALAPMPHGGSGLTAPLVKAPKAPPKSAAQQLGETIRKAVTDGINNIDGNKIGSMLGGALAKAFEWVAKNTGQLAGKLIDALAGMDWVDVGKKVGGHAMGFAIGFVSSLGSELFSADFWKKHWWDTIIAVLSVFGIGKIAGPLSKILSKIPILKIFAPLVEKLGGFTKPLSDGISKYIVKPLGHVGKAILDGIGAGFTKVFPQAAVKFDLFVGRLALKIIGYAGRFVGAGERMIGGLGGGILKAAGQLGKWAGQLLGYVLKPFARGGSLLWSKGAELVSGLKRGGIAAARNLATWAWETMGRPAVNAFRSAGSLLWSKGAALVGGLKNGIVSISRTLGMWILTHVALPMTSAFRNVGSWLVDKGRNLVGGLKSGIVGALKGIGTWIKSTFVDPIVSWVKKHFGINSPSRVFMGIGASLSKGLLKGLVKNHPADIVKKVFGSVPDALGTLVGKGLIKVQDLPGKAWKALKGLGSKLGGFFGGLFGGGGSKGGSVDRWASTVSTVLSMLGQPQSALGAVLKRIQMESGGNPEAINLWDSNAKAGHPSQGLMQTIPSTFAAYAGPFRSRGILDPLANIYAGINYAMHAYGKNWISVMTRPGGYAKGGFAQFGETAWVGEKGAELMQVTPQGTRIFNHQDSMAIAQAYGIRLPGYASGTIQNAADRVTRDRQKVEEAKDALSRARRRHKGEAAAEARLRAAQKELKAAEIALANARRSAKTGISNSIVTGLQKTLATGTAAAINSAIKSLATKLLNAGYSGTAKFAMYRGNQLAALSDRRAAVQRTIAAANQYATDQSSKISDFLTIGETSAQDINGLIGQLTNKQKVASDFVALTRKLKQLGASKDLLSQLSDAGPGSHLAAILSDSRIGRFDIGRLNKLIQGGSKLATSFGKDMADLMYDSGSQAGKGFLAGLKATEADLTRQMAKMAAALVSAIKKALKIKSPSQLMRDQVGRQIALGMVVGMDQHQPHVAAAGRRLATVAYAAAAAGSSARANAATAQLVQLLSSGQLGGAEVHVHFDDPTLKDLIRVTTNPMIKASEQRQARRAQVGRR